MRNLIDASPATCLRRNVEKLRRSEIIGKCGNCDVDAENCLERYSFDQTLTYLLVYGLLLQQSDFCYNEHVHIR